MKLRNMSAQVMEWKDVYVMKKNSEDNTESKIHIETAKVLQSYDSIVAIYGDGELYLLPRYDYSVTTWRHVHAFIQDHCSWIKDDSACVIRCRAQKNHWGYNFAMAYAYHAGNRTAIWKEY